MRSAPDITNVVEAANLDGRQERLEGMLAQLESCEKALQVGRGLLVELFGAVQTRQPGCILSIQPAKGSVD